jgi:hypothetical protein
MPELVDEEPEADEWAETNGRRHRLAAVAAAVIVLIGLGLGSWFAFGRSSSHPTPEGVPIQNAPDLASPNSTLSGAPVDGITCRKAMDQGVSYHIHVHVDVFVDGSLRRIPAGAGIVPPRIEEPAPGGVFVDNSNSSCLYWLHVHADDGIIHVESPHKQAFVLGQFFDIWGQPLSADQVGPARGPVVAFVNGQRFAGDPRNIPLTNLEVIQLDVGTPVVPYQPMHFTVTGSCSTSCAPPSSNG